MTECPPVFLIPGLLGIQCCYLQNAIRKIMSPVYVLDGNYSTSLDQMAIRLGKVIQLALFYFTLDKISRFYAASP